ncbi:MAG: hypothetical protein AAF125_18975 [Chloroflexota bacterium]
MCEGSNKTCFAERSTHPRFHIIAHNEFDRALRRASWSKARTIFTDRTDYLIALEEVRRDSRTLVHCGVQEVAIETIVGSSGRFRDFNADYLPLRRSPDDRWVSVAQAHFEGIQLPPVKLYKVEDAYFVEDGNHRVSVARVIGQETIRANVIELNFDS